jgi:7-cyano-7-deazaguanine synthase
MALCGGMDSTGLLLKLLADGYKVSCISYDYGQKHKIELERAEANIAYLAKNGYEVEHNLADLSSVMSMFHSALTSEDFDIPEGHYEEAQMKDTVVPNRNAIFASILYGYALSVAIREESKRKLHYDLELLYPSSVLLHNDPLGYQNLHSSRRNGTWT